MRSKVQIKLGHAHRTGYKMGHEHTIPQARPPTTAAKAAEHLLLDRVATGDYDAFREVYALYFPRLYRFVFRLTRQNELIEEIINDVMLVVWQQAGKFNNCSRVSTWIFGIAYRKTMKTLQRQKKSKSHSIDDLPEMIDPSSPYTHLVREQFLLQLQDSLQKLSFDQRSVIELTYIYGYSCSEIAIITNSPVNTVKTRMFYARKHLKELLPQFDVAFDKQQTNET